jgi:thiamine-phosphate pyrophosphorylase
MHIKNLKRYYFINKFEYSHLINLNKNISFIWRNKDKVTPKDSLMKLSKFCKENDRKFYISNNIKLAIKINANGVYIPSTNRSLNFILIKPKKEFKILGSAHNLKEIKIKELQNVEEIFLSPLFKSNKNPQLNLYKYLNLKKSTFLKDISLGGINDTNIKKLEFLKPFGFAAISYFDKKKGP